MADDQVTEPSQVSNEPGGGSDADPQPRKRAARSKKKAAEPAGSSAAGEAGGDGSTPGTEPATSTPRKRTAKATAATSATKKAASAKAGKSTAAKKSSDKTATGRAGAKKAPPAETPADDSPAVGSPDADSESGGSATDRVDAGAPAKKAARKTTKKSSAAKSKKAAADGSSSEGPASDSPGSDQGDSTTSDTALLFQAPDAAAAPARRRTKAVAADPTDDASAEPPAGVADLPSTTGEDTDDGEGGPRRRRRRGGRRRRKSGEGAEATEAQTDEAAADDAGAADSDEGTTRRRRRRRRAGEEPGDGSDDPANTVTRVRQSRSAEDQITAVTGSTRLEAKKQRRREGREAGRRRAPIVSEAEFLARRESVERVMVIRQRAELTQIAVLEDKVLVEHYVARESQTSLIGNVYLGRVQNVLPSMEAAFIDIGKGRNAVLYAGEVNWSALGHPEGQPRKIESVLSSGQTVLVQVTKDPVGHKGARLTSQISLAGRFLVYVPDGTTSGISRKLPDTERNRLKSLLKEIVPDTAGVIVRTAAEGASEEELTRDVERLKARWEDIEAKVKGNAPALLYGEPDLTLKVVRDLFTEDFTRLVIEGDDAWDTVQGYVAHVAPDLEPRLQRHQPGESGSDVFATYRIDEQIAKGLDRKVWLPSGGSLIIDRTEAMTVVDVNTGKFTGSGGNLEETVTKNNLEAAEEIVRQLRLRDIGGIIVIDFIDMVLESNRDLVLRRLVECLGRDRTRHQVAEVTSLGLVQMTRKRIGTGLLEAFSQSCDHCHGRGVIVHDAPVEAKRGEDESRRSRRGRGRGRAGEPAEVAPKPVPSPKDVAAHARPVVEDLVVDDVVPEDVVPDEVVPEDVVPEDVVPDEVVSEEAVPEEVVPEEVVPEEAPVADGATEDPAPVAPVESGAAEPSPPDVAAGSAPVVVTRSRRRSASRPAGPPPAVVAGEVGAPAAHGAVEPGTAVVERSGLVAEPPGGADEEHSTVEHVPIKRRGARKR